MKILVTGATGKFGPVLVRKLIEEKHQVRALVHSTALDNAAAETVIGDVTNAEDIRKACDGVDCICHLATVKGDREKFLRVNLGGLYNLLEQVRAAKKPPQFILLSGDNVVPIYDYENRMPLDEDTPYLFVDDEYGLSKILEETAALQYAKKYDLPITILRGSWIMEGLRSAQLCHPRYGGWKRYLSDDMKDKLERGGKFLVVPQDKYGKPLKRHVVDPRDLAQAFVWALHNKNTYGEIFHIAGPSPFDYQELANFMTRRDPLPAYPISTPDAFSFEISISKACRFGYSPRFTIYDTVEWAIRTYGKIWK